MGGLVALVCLACGGQSGDPASTNAEGANGEGGGTDVSVGLEGGADGGTGADDGGGGDGQAEGDAGNSSCVGDPGDGGNCYAITCIAKPQSLDQNRDRLIQDLAKRKCTDSCTLWAALNKAERYIFLMDTAYFADKSSLLYPPNYNATDTALDHAVALYSINGPKAGQGVDGSGLGGNDYNRIYLGFDALAECVFRNFPIANPPPKDPNGNQWVKSDDLAGPHAPFNQREMIFWYKATLDLQSNGPKFHHWHQDSSFSQSGINQRLGVCGVTDRSLVESTIAFDFYHNSDPLGDYTDRGGYGWQIVDQHVSIMANWNYMPTGCAVSQPVNSDTFGGGTYNGMGPVLDGGACTSAGLVDGGC
jgi:hypothetical protein